MIALQLLRGSPFGAAIAVIIYKVAKLVYHINQARKTGLPYTIVPVLENEVTGKLLTPLLRRMYRERLFRGENWPRWIRFTVLDWSYEDRGRAHEALGDVFLVVSPEGLVCYSADAEMSWDVSQRKTEFIRPRDKYKLLEPFGPNVATTEGKAYNFHVRMTAPPFNESSGVNDLVWEESASQAQGLVRAWTQEDSTRDLSLDINRVSLGVIAKTGFGKQLDFETESLELKTSIPTGYTMGLHHALHLVISFIVPILIFPKWIMRLLGMKEAAAAHGELEKHLREMIRSETTKLQRDDNYQSREARGNLLTSVLRASAAEGKAANRKQVFTEDEVLGNLFVYLLAGYETVANSMTYGFIILALRPDLQARVTAEVDRVYAEAASEGRAQLDYRHDFDKFRYTYGFMHEVFRLYPAVAIMTKMVAKDTTINVYPQTKPTQQYVLPPDCQVYLNVNAIHYSKRYWPEPYEIKPERWENPTGAKIDATSEKKAPTDTARQLKGELMTFSVGPRGCLGRRFAHIEYVSVLATVLKNYRIVLGEGLDPAMVKQELDNLASGTVTLSPLKYVKLTLQKR